MLQTPTEITRNRMRRTRQRDTACEIHLRRELYRRGFRYLVDVAPIRGQRVRADILFRRARLAVFVDGCFWHMCPLHGTLPRTNQEWWRTKLAANVTRDVRNRTLLESEGWQTIRVWEHEDPLSAAERIAETLMANRRNVIA